MCEKNEQTEMKPLCSWCGEVVDMENPDEYEKPKHYAGDLSRLAIHKKCDAAMNTVMSPVGLVWWPGNFKRGSNEPRSN